jgi:putative endonuclease
MTRATNAVGAYGERVATRALITAGLLILARNWSCAEGEIDIIALDGDTIVFCEVKTRRGARLRDPGRGGQPGQGAPAPPAGARWLAEHPSVRGEVRFDVVSVVVPRRGGRPSNTSAARSESRTGAFAGFADGCPVVGLRPAL